MNLEGSLGAFGLPDVVTLLASTGKTGGLLLHRDGGRAQGAVWFREGRVCGATSDRGRASLVRRLVGSGALEDAALRQAVSRAVSHGGGVAKALLESGSVDPELLRQAADDQAVDAVFDLLRWADGEFAFDPESVDPDAVGLDVEPERLLAEARARIDAWPALEALVPGLDAVVTVPTVLDVDPEVTRDEWALLSLVDGHRTVLDLVELTGAGAFAVTTLLARLVERGLLTVKEPGSADHVALVERRLGMLASVESGTVAEPEAVAPASASDDGSGPGALGMSAAAALAAARAAQSLGQPGTSGRPDVGRPRHEVVPPRPEPFLPGRRPEHPEPAAVPAAPAMGPSDAAAVRAGAAAAPPVRAGGSAPFSAPPGLASHAGVAGSVDGATARSLAAPAPDADSVIERDPSVNRSLLLRLIAGVRGL